LSTEIKSGLDQAHLYTGSIQKELDIATHT